MRRQRDLRGTFCTLKANRWREKRKKMDLAEEIAKEHAHFASVHGTNTG